MGTMRTFPQPDPMMRFIHPDDAPMVFDQLKPQSRSRALRIYLLGRAAGMNTLWAWETALDFSEEGDRNAEDVLSYMSDDEIEKAMSGSAAAERRERSS